MLFNFVKNKWAQGLKNDKTMSDNQKTIVEEREHVVIKFAGDSGDGMQFTGIRFSETSAMMGNQVSTFPDYPAEIRAPKGTIGGVSGFQIHIGSNEVITPGDEADVLVALNPAALKANLRWVKKGGTIIVDIDTFTPKNIEKAGFQQNPLQNGLSREYQIIEAPITTLTKEAVKDLKVDHSTAIQSRNMFALGIVYWLFHRDLKYTENFFEKKFKNKPILIEVNKRVLNVGYNYAMNIQLSRTYIVKPTKLEPGKYRHINGNTATAWGLIAAAEKAGLQLFLGSYPITPASEILQEMEARRDLDVIAFQAEDEIAGIVSTIGAAFTGKLAATSTSGPGLALKSEALNLAVMLELPIVVIDVQRGGPSTGLPTKPEQSDLLQALWGRNGESPIVVIAASTPTDCFDFAFISAKIALEHMTPVVLLTDGYLANGSKPWKIPDLNKLPQIKPPILKAGELEKYYPYERIPGTYIRKWAIAGTRGYEHVIGGLEKEAITGHVSYDPENHERMVLERENKIKEIQKEIPPLEVFGEQEGELLIIGWGSSFGHIHTAVQELRQEGYKIGHAHFYYINPLPPNTEQVLSKFKKSLVIEMNRGQFFRYLRTEFPQFQYYKYNKVQGIHFTVSEIKNAIKKNLEG